MGTARCPSLEALVTEVVVAQVDACDGPVDTKGVGEGLQSWHDAHCQVDSRVAGVSLQHSQLAIPHVCRKHAQGTGQNCQHVPNMTFISHLKWIGFRRG